MKNKFDYEREKVIESFVISSMKSMRANLKNFNYLMYEKNILLYTSAVNACVAKLLQNSSITNKLKMTNFLNMVFFSMLKDFKNQNISENLEALRIIEDKSDVITFLIWSVDSYFYFFKYSGNPYTILKEYASYIEIVLKKKDTLLHANEFSDEFCTLIYG